ncbi:MAG: DASS family sodium-coupled anion symporter [Thermoanaerobacteraceae bacterium]|nr:DASS family sodium-coupled anion symporter [Thermoanaerobacteraceae bacterium]
MGTVIKQSETSVSKKTVFSLIAALAVYISITAFVPAPWSIWATFGAIGLGTVFWVSRPVPLSMTAILVILVLVVSRAVALSTTLSGFATGSLFLVLAGFMMAQGVNQTNLGRRMAFTILARFGSSPASALWGLFLALEILAFAVPATAVRTLLLLPAVVALIESVDPGKGSSNVKKLFLFALCFGVNVTGAGVLPGALANVMTAELVSGLTGESFGYYRWLLYAFPISLVLIPMTWFILLKVFPVSVKNFDSCTFKQYLDDLGPMDWKEKRCAAILTLTVVLWMAEPLHGWHPAVPAIMATLLMGFPGIGIVAWEKLLEINWGTILLLGTSLSLGNALNESGGADFIAGIFLSWDWLKHIFAIPILAAVVVTALTIVYHLAVGHVSTVVATLIPVIVQISYKLGADPLLYGFLVGISSLFGFILVIETIPSIIVYNSGYLHPLDWLKPGILISLAVLVAVALVAWLWWPVIGLL